MKKEDVIPNAETCLPIDPGVPNTRVYIPIAGFGGDLRPIINRTVKFTKVTSQVIGEEFLQGLESHAICDRGEVERNGLHLPGFRIYDSNYAQTVLEEFDYAGKTIAQNGLLLVFRLPGFTEVAWNRALELGQTPTEMSQSVEYKLGRKSADTFNQQRKDQEKRKRLGFRRINSAKDHEPGSFYHLWEVTPPDGTELKNRERKVA